MKDFYATATMNLLLPMDEEKQKAVFDFITMLKDLKHQEKGESETTTKKPEEPYKQNETMRMIGRLSIEKYISSKKVKKGIDNILQARGFDARSAFDVVFDAFLFGCITGKQEERAKKKATPTATKQGSDLF